MRRRKRCCCCHGRYKPYLQTYQQQRICSKPACRAWYNRHRWRMWSLKNPYYWESRRKKQKAWREAHLDYWRRWRAKHPRYVERNRAAQKLRNAKKREKVAKPTGWNALCRYKLARIRYLRVIAKPTESIDTLVRQIDGICRYLEWHVLIAKPTDIDIKDRILRKYGS